MPTAFQSIRVKSLTGLHVHMIRNSTNYTGKDDNIKRPDVDYLFYLSEIAFAVELALAKATEQDSIFKIRSVQDVYHILTDKETLEKVLNKD